MMESNKNNGKILLSPHLTSTDSLLECAAADAHEARYWMAYVIKQMFLLYPPTFLNQAEHKADTLSHISSRSCRKC